MSKVYRAVITRVQETHIEFDESEIREGESPEDVAYDISRHMDGSDWDIVDTEISVTVH